MTINGVIRGYLLIALIQGILMGLGLVIFGVPNPALWGLVAGIAALVPTIGTGLVAIPIIIYLYTTGDTASAVGFLAWATVIVGLIDNLLNPIIVGRKINIHPLVILFSVLGGIALLGPAGILVGPLIVSLLYTLGNMYLRKFEKVPAE
jgi:predicted PurR-regulated permease PerM